MRLVSRETLRRAVDELCTRDTDLGRVVQWHGPPPLWARRPNFATLVRIILEQQVSLASAESTFRRLQRVVQRVTPERVARLPLAEIRRLGFTRQKAEYCLDLARLIEAGGLNLSRLSRADDGALCAQRYWKCGESVPGPQTSTCSWPCGGRTCGPMATWHSPRLHTVSNGCANGRTSTTSGRSPPSGARGGR